MTAPNGAVVGKLMKDGVLDQVRGSSRQGRDCRGPVDGKGSPAAMWVFSSDACGTYDLPYIRVTHAGRTEPVGVISLISEKGQFNLARGAGIAFARQPRGTSIHLGFDEKNIECTRGRVRNSTI